MSPLSSFDVHVTGTGGTRVIHAAGRLVAGAGADAPAWAATSALVQLEHVLMDLGGVTAIDAGGVGAIVALRQTLARRGTRLTIIGASARVRCVLHLTRLDAIFGIVSGRDGGAAAGLCRCA
ncbi:MAG: STAS domain-containing protein [Acidobacteria bacterium]|nr:STAS domain-containing protein [Acidobacteriota bacterium]